MLKLSDAVGSLTLHCDIMMLCSTGDKHSAVAGGDQFFSLICPVITAAYLPLNPPLYALHTDTQKH